MPVRRMGVRHPKRYPQENVRVFSTRWGFPFIVSAGHEIPQLANYQDILTEGGETPIMTDGFRPWDPNPIGPVVTPSHSAHSDHAHVDQGTLELEAARPRAEPEAVRRQLLAAQRESQSR